MCLMVTPVQLYCCCFCSSEIDLDTERPAKRLRTEDGDQTDFSMASLTKGEITEVYDCCPAAQYVLISSDVQVFGLIDIMSL